jgi:hypothetical protein
MPLAKTKKYGQLLRDNAFNTIDFSKYNLLRKLMKVKIKKYTALSSNWTLPEILTKIPHKII